ncbi:MAG: glycosyltransferase, partial [Actinobacteria bacterium]
MDRPRHQRGQRRLQREGRRARALAAPGRARLDGQPRVLVRRGRARVRAVPRHTRRRGDGYRRPVHLRPGTRREVPDRRRHRVAGPGVAAPVAVAVVSWNTRELLARCLESLAGEADAGRAEVWVVDNASDDGSAELVAERFGWVRLERAGVNLGFGAAVNRVAAGTDTPWLAMANADVRVRAGALERLLAAGAADSGAGALAPRLLLPDGSAQHSVFPFPSVPFALGLNLGALRLAPALADRLALPGSWDSERARRVPWAIGAFLLVRRPAWDAAGGFDESQWLYAEDLDLGWRLRRAGWA